jgi:hypothetical protein
LIILYFSHLRKNKVKIIMGWFSLKHAHENHNMEKYQGNGTPNAWKALPGNGLGGSNPLFSAKPLDF